MAGALVAVGGLVVLPGAQGADKAPAKKASVKVVDYEFKSSRVKIRAGGKVTWRFKQGRHNVTGKGWKSSTKKSGTYRHKFKRQGTYDYVCTLHPEMKGTVRVAK